MEQLGQVADISQGLVTAGRGAGARSGGWRLSVVESADLIDGRLTLGGGREIEIERTERTERHLLRPFDILVTARAQAVKAALVPPEISRTVAGSTLLVLRVPDPGSGLAQFLWYYLTSSRGLTELSSRLTGSSLPSLSVKALAEVPVPIPSLSALRALADLIEASEDAYFATLNAAEIRRSQVRDALVGEFVARNGQVESAAKEA